MNKSLEESKAVVNPSYNRDLSAKDRFRDFLGAYHIILNGVVKHDPFTLENEGQPGIRCDNEDKQDMIRFVEILIADSLAQYKREILEKVIGEDEEGIGINNYHNGINRKQKARNEFRQELRNRLKELEL